MLLKIAHKPGQVIDQQDDSGTFWEEEFSHLWPKDLEEPDIGIQKRAGIIEVFDGMNTTPRYPIDTPEDILASSMYFERFGDEVFDKEACDKISEELATMREIFDLEMPELMPKEAGMDEPEDVFADKYGHLPVTTPQQLLASVDTFEKNASKWNAGERIAIRHNFKEAAQLHEVEVDVPFNGKIEESPHAQEAIELRKQAMQEYRRHFKHNGFDVTDCDQYIEDLDLLSDDIFEKAAQLEELDKQAGMDEAWGKHFPDPVESLLVGSPGPFEKEAEQSRWASADFDKLRGVLEDDVVDEIAADPDAVIPSLPMHYRNVVEDIL